MSETDSMKADALRFGGVTPILNVQNLEASIAYYVNALGFKVDWEHRDVIASVSRDHCGIFLCEGDQGHPGSWVWIGVGDVDALFEEYKNSGTRVRHPPTNYAWAREMQVEDPDGNVLRFGSDPKPDEPLGEWLDMHGRRWATSADGG